MKSYSHQDIKLLNRRAVFRFIQEKPGQQVSRPEIARALRITEPTVMKIVAFFEQRGLLRAGGEEAERASVGRKPNLLTLVPDAAVSVGMEYDGARLSVAVVDLNGKALSFHTHPLSAPLDEVLAYRIPEQVGKLSLPRSRCLGLGLALPGSVDPVRRRLRMHNPAIDAGGRTDFSADIAALQHTIGMPVLLENDVNAAAIAQSKALSAESGGDFVFLTLGIGLGAGIVLDGKLRRGRHFAAGEVGYMTRDTAYAAHPNRSGWLEQQLRRETLRERFGFDPLLDDPGPRRGELAGYVAEHVALIVANLSAALDVDTFILGGYLAEQLGDALLDRLQTLCERICVPAITLQADASPDRIARGMGAVVTDAMLGHFLADSFIPSEIIG